MNPFSKGKEKKVKGRILLFQVGVLSRVKKDPGRSVHNSVISDLLMKTRR